MESDTLWYNIILGIVTDIKMNWDVIIVAK